jgi:hypothetical protein
MRLFADKPTAFCRKLQLKHPTCGRDKHAVQPIEPVSGVPRHLDRSDLIPLARKAAQCIQHRWTVLPLRCLKREANQITNLTERSLQIQSDWLKFYLELPSQRLSLLYAILKPHCRQCVRPSKSEFRVDLGSHFGKISKYDVSVPVRGSQRLDQQLPITSWKAIQVGSRLWSRRRACNRIAGNTETGQVWLVSWQIRVNSASPGNGTVVK